MKCPQCQSGDIEVVEKSAGADEERPGYRHHHGKCRKCHAMLWWSAPIGVTDAVVKAGAHECAFFKPAAS
jgi:hypothetical protein